MRYHDLKIGIVGAGSIGVCLAVALASKGYNVELVNKKADRICIGCAEVFNIFGDFGNISYLVPTVKSISQFSSKKDFIICATKAYDTVEYVGSLKNHLSKDGAVVSIQNILSADRLMKLIPADMSICMYLDICCKNFPQGKYVVDTGGVTLGVYNPDAFSKMKVWEHIMGDICKVNLTNNVFGFVLGRNILNGAIALLGAISGLPLGKILKDKRAVFLFNKIIEEAMYIAQRYRIQVLPYNEKFDYYRFIKDKKYNKQMISILRKNNKNIRSAILEDIERGKKTELEFLLGSFYKYSTKSKTKTPYINAIYGMVNDIECGKQRVCKTIFCDDFWEELEKKIKD